MSVYNRAPRARIGKSAFNLSYEKKFTCDMAELIPTMCDEVVPGDVFNIGANLVIRMQPLVAPVMHEINAYIHYFFVPYRLLWDDWEEFITGGEDGTSTPTLPVWVPGSQAVGTIADYLGFPTGIAWGTGGQPLQFPINSYNRIYNEYYRDETQQAELTSTNNAVLDRNWEKDYFTSALPWQQRGTAPALPISGTIEIDGIDRDIKLHNETDATALTLQTIITTGNVGVTAAPSASDDARWSDPALEVDLSSGVTFDVSDLRLAFQTQRFLERNATGGVRYTEFLRSHFGVFPRDERLDRCEYIGGMKTPLIISEVLQTESSDASTPQGTMAGHGITVDRKFITKYRVKEFGLIMGIMSIMPRTAYSQGINRQWLKETKYDFYFPEFAHLSEQAVTHAELYTSATPADNTSVFGYQGRYNELRSKQNMICGDLRSTYDYWHLGRQFSSKPSLNSAFITADPRKDIFAAPSADGFIVSVGNIIKAIRPVPYDPNPGFVDH